MFLAFGILPVLVSQSYGVIFLAPMGVGFLLWSFFSFRSGKQISDERHSWARPDNGGQDYGGRVGTARGPVTPDPPIPESR
jgi:hypothetical protein